jgi:hypothetical protein
MSPGYCTTEESGGKPDDIEGMIPSEEPHGAVGLLLSHPGSLLTSPFPLPLKEDVKEAYAIPRRSWLG